jgi:LuxR family transcriptional regulator, maltose regulon positive regulatory protein
MNKINRPISNGTCLRHRLFKKIDEMRDLPVVWISAPPGSGKTTLISSYLGFRKIPCLWCQLDQGDEDLATFFYYVGQAIRKAAPGFRKPMPLFTPEYSLGIPNFAMKYFEELGRRMKKPSALVFDNYQAISSDSPFHEMINGVVSRIPAGMTVFFIGRSALPPSFIRLKANSQIGLLLWDDICLSENETKTIIRGKIKKQLPPETALHLHTLSGGWAAGLVLMIEAMKERKVEPQFLITHAADEIFLYFARETFNHLDCTMQEFLVKTAFLPQMTVRMAEELTGNPHSSGMLHELHRNNCFITRRCHSEAVYEYHPLFRSFLLNHAAGMLPSDVLSRIKGAAAMTLDYAGDHASAVSLLVDIGDWEQLSNVIVRCAAEMLSQGRIQPLREWLAILPSTVRESNSRLKYYNGMCLLPYNPQSARSEFEKAFKIFQAANDLLGTILSASGAIHSIVFSFENFSRLDRWLPILISLTAQSKGFPNEGAEAFVLAAMIEASELGTVPHPEAETWAKRIMDLAESPKTHSSKVHAMHAFMWRRLLYVGCHDALPLLHYLQQLTQHPYSQPLSVIAFHSALVQFHMTMANHREVMEAAGEGLQTAQHTGVHVEDMWFYLHAAVSCIDCMDLKNAEIWMNKALSMYTRLSNRARCLYHLQLSRMAFIRKNFQRALSEANRMLDYCTEANHQLTGNTHLLMRAQILKRMGSREEAFEHLQQVYQDLLPTDCRSYLAIARLIEAQFHFEDGEEDRGREFLGQAFAIARKGEYAFGLLDDPNHTMHMCEKALEEGIEVAYVGNIIRRRAFVPEKPPVHIEEWPWALKITTLGKFSIIREDKPLGFSRKTQQKPLALLKAIIALGGQNIKEERLSEILWPDVEGDMAHQSFNTTLHRLRKLLGQPEALSMQGGRISVDNRYCWIDIHAFERLLQESELLRKNGGRDRACSLVEKAVAIYRGDFLAGEPEAPWMLALAERLKSLFSRNASWLGHYLEESGRYESAAEHYERFLELDNSREDFYRRLMVCYDKLGRKSDALAVYQRCLRTLSSSLGMSPSRETNTIRAAIFQSRRG